MGGDSHGRTGYVLPRALGRIGNGYMAIRGKAEHPLMPRTGQTFQKNLVALCRVLPSEGT